MTNRIIRLQQINKNLEPVVQFARYDDEEDRPGYGGLVAAGAGAAGAGYGGYKLHGAIRASQTANPGTSYVQGARNVGATGVAKTAGYIRGAQTGIASAAASGKETLEEQGRALLNKGVSQLRGAQNAASNAGQTVGMYGRKIMAGGSAAGKEAYGIGKAFYQTGHTGSSVAKKVLGAGMKAAKATFSVDERLIMLSTPRYEIRF